MIRQAVQVEESLQGESEGAAGGHSKLLNTL